MSKEMSDEELKVHCQKAVEILKDALLRVAGNKDGKIRKRAMLIAYWLRDYVRYFTKEDEFDPHSVYRLKRGSVIQVEFGYRVGRELGGRHYAVVLDCDNKLSGNTVTVVPLGSVKEKDDVSTDYRIILDDGLFDVLCKKVRSLIDEAGVAISEVPSLGDEEGEIYSKDDILCQLATLTEAEKKLKLSDTWLTTMEHMKQGSVALVGQIVTISKMRITQPLQKTHLLYGVRLSSHDLDMIDEGLKKLYFHKVAAETNNVSK